MDVPIKVIKDFVPNSDIQTIVTAINYLEETLPDSFAVDPSGLRLALQFGSDAYHPQSHENLGAELSLLGKNQALVQSYFQKVLDIVKRTFSVTEDLYVCSFWLGKQYPGATVPFHDDTDSGFSPQNKYSGIVYLNTMELGGELSFADYDFVYKPKAGGLVIFPSREGGSHGVSEINETRYSLLFWLTFDSARSLV